MPLHRFDTFRKAEYENQVVILITALATARVGGGILFDFYSGTSNRDELIIDISFIAIFITILLYTARSPKIRKIPPFFGFFFVIVLAINFAQFGGTESFSEFNYYSGFVVTIMLYSGRWLYRLLFIQFVVLLFMVYLQHSENLSFINNFFLVEKTTNPVDFLFSLVSILFLAYYLRRITKIEVRKINLLNKILSEKIGRVRSQNKLLKEKAAVLRETQESLQEKIRERTLQLQTQNEALEQYIFYNTNSLQEPLERLMKAAERIDDGNHLLAMTVSSCNDLNHVIQNIKRTIESEEELSRNRIASYEKS